MAPKVTPEADATGEAADVPNFLGVTDTGAAYGRRRILKAILILEDGGRVVIDLPGPARPAKDWTKTRAGRAILEAMAQESRPLKAATIAKLAGSEYSGSFRQALKGLVDQGEVVPGEDGYELAG